MSAHKSFTSFVLAASLFFYLFFALHSIAKIPLGDEVLQAALIDRHDEYKSDDALKHYAVWGHPMLYGEALLALGRIFKPHYVTARVLGIGIFFSVVAALFLLAREVFSTKEGAEWMAAAIFLYSTHPMVIQGSLLLDRDNTFFTFFLSLFLLFLIRDRKQGHLKYFVLCVASLVFLMWAKLAPLPLVMASIFLFDVLFQKKLFVRDAVMVFTSVAIFVASWFFYCAFLHPPEGVVAKDIFLYLFKSAGTRYQTSSPGIGSFTDIAKTVVYVVLWMNPFLCVMVLFSLYRTARWLMKEKKLQAEEILHVVFCVFFAAYVLFGRIMFGFPKYHYPILFIFCLLAASCFSEKEIMKREDMLVFGLFSLIVCAFCILFLDDVFRVAYFDVKKSFMDSGGITPELKHKILVQWFVLAACGAFAWLVVRAWGKQPWGRSLKIAMLLCGISLNFSQNVAQMQKDVSTIACYGESGTQQMIEYVRGRLRGQHFVLAPQQILFYLKQLRKKKYPDDFFNHRGGVLKELQSENIQFFIYGVNTHTLQQVRDVFLHPDVQAFLKTHFRERRVGTYVVWERKSI